jgi:hypothetical protein
MNDKVIEPTEILIDGDGTIRQEEMRANPWLRLAGRMADYGLFFTALGLLRKGLGISLSFLQFEGLIPFEYLLWVPIEAVCLWGLGRTPGKWLVGTHLRQGKNQRLSYVNALRRSAKVWFRGLGMGIPFVNAICMLVAYQRLMVFKTTTWDHEDHIQISHRPVGTWRLIFAVAVAVIGFAFYFN